MMRLYISGGMSGYSDDDIRERFGAAEKFLKDNHCKVCNPARWRWLLRFLPYRFALAFDILLMCFCDGIFLLDGWTMSDGATAEHRFACSVGMAIFFEK